MILRKLLTTPLKPIPKGVSLALLIVALIGFCDATFLTVEHYTNKIPPCSVGGCESVLTSQYSALLGVPVSLFGALYYFIFLVLILLYIDTKKDIFLKIPLVLSALGALGSLGFMYIMIFVIKAFCPYCTVSAVTSFILFGFAAYIFRKNTASISTSQLHENI